MKNNSLEDKLLVIFQNVNEWLKFAEAKNGVLIGLIAASLFGLLSNWNSLNCNTQFISTYIVFPFGLIALLILLITFIPRFNIPQQLFDEKDNIDEKINMKRKNKDSKSVTINLYYFKDLRNFKKMELIDEICKRSGIEKPERQNLLELDLAEQIINNSFITDRKFILFNYAVNIVLTGLILSLIIGTLKTIC